MRTSRDKGDTPTSRKLRRTRWSGIVSGAKQRWWLRSRVFRYYNFYTTNSAWCDFSPLVFSNQEKMLEFIRNLRRSTSQQLRPSGNENIKINVTPPQDSSNQPAEEERVQWDSPMQFFMTILGFCVGLGNIWRFPYLCQKNGGGAFIIPFLVMMVLEGMPLLLLELGIGQKMRTGSFGVWNRVHPLLGGIGLGSTVVAMIVGCYYNVIIAWCLFYLYNSLSTTLPWAECPTEIIGNISMPVAECAKSSETSYFWYREALDISESIADFDGIRGPMLLCLALAWILVYLIIMKGIKSSGYVVYFTAGFPYIVMTIFFIRGITLPGATEGLMHMFNPDLVKLGDPQVWLDAANQVFFSYGLAFGSIISFGSYNTPDKNCVKDVFILSACNAFTAVYACAVIFSILGFKAQHLFNQCLHRDVGLILQFTDVWQGKSIEDVSVEEYTGLMNSHVINLNATLANETFIGENSLKNCSLVEYLNDAASGTGLAFIVMADVFTKLPGSPAWSLLFFSMLLSLGLGSQIGILEGMISTLFEMPQLKNVKKPILTGSACLLCFLVGLVFTTGAGEYWLTLFDTYGAMGLTFIALIEITSLMYVYGHERFTDDIEEMTGVRPGLYWQLTWRLIAPVMLTGLLLMSIIKTITSSPEYSAWIEADGKSEKKKFPAWTLGVATILSLASVMPIVLVALLRKLGITKPHVDYEAGSPLKRIETNASSAPMMPTHGFKDREDSPTDDQDSQDDEIEIRG